MEQFKEKVRINTVIFSIATIILGAISLLGLISEAGVIDLLPTAGDSRWHSLWRGFISGASCGALLVMVFGLSRNIKALHDEKEMKKLYIKENDERCIQIWTSARAVAYQTFLILGLVATVVAGYFSATVSLTLLCCIVAASFIGLIFKIYYSKKF